MEISGFRYIDGREPSPEEVGIIERAFHERASPDSTYVVGNKECDDFIESVTGEPVGLLLAITRIGLTVLLAHEDSESGAACR